jgi:glycine/D-amino acid oxidase-like deaminating enzyme
VTHVAVLGAGIMGASTALFLAHRGVRVTLFDEAARPFEGASRWNEGKIHLGYLYAADPSLETARRILPGGLAFRALTEELIGRSLDLVITPGVDTYLIDRRSVVDADATARYFAHVAALIEEAGGGGRYLVPFEDGTPQPLSRSELDRDYDTASIAAGVRVPERSVSTRWIADRFVEALIAEPRVEPRLSTRVMAVRRTGGAADSPLVVGTADGDEGPFDYVVNALWQGRLAIDAGLGLPLPDVWSHRLRLSVFLQTTEPVDVPNTVVATGPFGDVKNYNGRDFYLSWYPAGLVAEGVAVDPPHAPALDRGERARIATEIADRIGRIVRSVADLQAHTADLRLEGGWVSALGQGSLADPRSTLHRRDRIGITSLGRYLSVDTGKYSIAPWLARQVTARICGPDARP